MLHTNKTHRALPATPAATHTEKTTQDSFGQLRLMLTPRAAPAALLLTGLTQTRHTGQTNIDASSTSGRSPRGDTEPRIRTPHSLRSYATSQSHTNTYTRDPTHSHCGSAYPSPASMVAGPSWLPKLEMQRRPGGFAYPSPASLSRSVLAPKTWDAAKTRTRPIRSQDR